jgi:hypothetical protein
MGTSYNPPIVRNGLVAYYDAGNSKSYPGTGTVWYDLTRNKNHLTFQNSGSITFSANYFSTGTNGYFYTASSNVPTGNSAYTMQIWVRRSSIVDAKGLMAIGGFGTNNQSNALRMFNTDSLNHYWWNNDLAANISSYFVSNKWFMATALFDGTNRRVYFNGNLINSDVPSNHNVTTSEIYVAKTYSTEYFQGDVSNARIYNRGLTATEILQNYNATKGRFGL